ncbi:hypothetical protein EPO05_05035 [Patescibacteria group bacterium]|nr:MAG: hypothetical protein EPO05_05035 [Patescibacteria group bacterium]
MKDEPRILVLSTGEALPNKGGSGFEQMVLQSRTNPRILNGKIVAVISNHQFGGVRDRAFRLGIPFEHWAGPFTAEGYQEKVAKYQADHTTCSGWLKPVRGLEPEQTTNIHPAMPISRFGGPGFWGHHVHSEVHAAFLRGEITQTGVTMHFVTDYQNPADYDKGPIFWEFPVLLEKGDTPDSIGAKVNKVEHCWQSYMLNKVIQGDIYLDPKTLTVHYRGE